MLNTHTLNFHRVRFAALAVIIAASVPIAWYLGSPLFLNQTVSESIPAAATSDRTALVEISRGQFGAIDSIHKGEGVAAIYRQADNQRILRLDEFKVTNGPDLYVYLSANPAPTTSAQLHDGGAVEIARLKGNIGSQNYALAADVDISQFKSVVIYCKQFGVVFSAAALVTQ